MTLSRRSLVAVLVCAVLGSAAARSQSVTQVFVDKDHTIRIDAARGADRTVDYAALVRVGPWDDRNYALTAKDLALLSPNESDVREPLPAFYRVLSRRESPWLRKSGPAQYPRHTLPLFLQRYGGYLVNGTTYRDVAWAGDHWEVVLEEPAVKESAATDAGFVSGEVRVSTPNGGAESAVKVHPSNVNKVIAGSCGPIAGQTMWYSTNGGSTWTSATLPLGNTNGDPAVDWSSDGTYAYTTTLGACGFNACSVWFYRSNDGGATWNGLESTTPGNPRRAITSAGQSDKEYLHVDKTAGSPFKDRIYVTWHDNNVMKFSMSSDFGNTFSTALSFGSANADLGIGSDITTGPGGEIYYVWPGFNSKTIRMRKSTNGGTSFGASVVVANTQASFSFPLPSIEAREAFVYVSADTDVTTGPFRGRVYVAWTDSTAATSGTPANNHGRIQVARSTDGGTTWAVTTPHETADATTVDRYHPWLAVGPDGTVHVIYYDTRRSAGRTAVDVFYSWSNDGAVTWSTPSRVTTVQSNNIADGFEFGDYNGLDNVLNSLIGIWTDNRKEASETGDSVDVYAAGITPGGGSTSAGHVPDGKFTPGSEMTVVRAGTNLTLSWAAACGPATDYATYEGTLGVANSFLSKACTSSGATTITITPAGGNRSYVIVPLAGGKEGSYGRKSDGTERSPASVPCAPQSIAACP